MTIALIFHDTYVPGKVKPTGLVSNRLGVAILLEGLCPAVEDLLLDSFGGALLLLPGKCHRWKPSRNVSIVVNIIIVVIIIIFIIVIIIIVVSIVVSNVSS